MRDNPIGIFDSGSGGLNVLRECERIMPDEKYIYLADGANMPYGNKSVNEIMKAACSCADILVSMRCKAIAVACNTATVTAIDRIRELNPDTAIVGLEPAVKPCFRELGRHGYAVALVTRATFTSAKFVRLSESCNGKIVPAVVDELAKVIEDGLPDVSAAEPLLRDALAPYADAEAVVLGCSHYSYIAGIVKNIYGGNIKIYDGAAGEAERLKYCLELADLRTKNAAGGGVEYYTTVVGGGVRRTT